MVVYIYYTRMDMVKQQAESIYIYTQCSDEVRGWWRVLSYRPGEYGLKPQYARHAMLHPIDFSFFQFPCSCVYVYTYSNREIEIEIKDIETLSFSFSNACCGYVWRLCITVSLPLLCQVQLELGHGRLETIRLLLNRALYARTLW